jgi:Chitobiase/beta-hexosaminidase C-terminal domain
MRSLIAALFFLATLSATAQDPTQIAIQQAEQANQIATQQAQMAAQQAMQANQQASDQAMHAMQQAADTANNPCCIPVSKPSISIKPGAYTAPLSVRLKDRTRGATIFYTTDGWTPTTHSTRYTGPIPITTTTTLQAIAVVRHQGRSPIATALYTLPAATTPITSLAISLPALTPGAAIPLTFTAPVTSKGLQVGDTLPIGLAQDLYIAGVLAAPRSTPVLATVTQIDPPGLAGAPATLTFAVHSITMNGRTIPLSATETKEGLSRQNTSVSLLFIPVVGLSGVLIHGQEATIPKGATLTALVASAGDTPPLTAPTP